jgi:hypothetical protein
MFVDTAVVSQLTNHPVILTWYNVADITSTVGQSQIKHQTPDSRTVVGTFADSYSFSVLIVMQCLRTTDKLVKVKIVVSNQVPALN